MRGSPIDSPIRDANPCKFCTGDRHTACQDTCKRLRLWLDEVARVKKNREDYLRRLSVSFNNRKK